MNKVAIAFSTKDRTELSKQSIEPLLQPNKFDLFWVDGSVQAAAQDFPCNYGTSNFELYGNVTGGADAAIVFSLSTMLNHPANYDFVGLCENDVLLDPDWFEKTMELFDAGKELGLEVGAVSARAYEDRILLQHDGFAVMFNLGAGHVVFSRRAAMLVLENFRTGWSSEIRRTFAQLTDLDIARWAPFVQQPHITCADWQFDRTLAQHGLVSLALTPAKCQMIGQVPSLEEQGLKLVTAPVEERRDDKAMELLIARTARIRSGDLKMANTRFMQQDDGSYLIMPHQFPMLGGEFLGDWRLKWNQGIGPFSWVPGGADHILPFAQCPIYGSCSLMLSGGKTGAKIEISDAESGWTQQLTLQPEGDQGQVLNLPIPGTGAHRLHLTALEPGATVIGIMTRDMQPYMTDISFEHSQLPGT